MAKAEFPSSPADRQLIKLNSKDGIYVQGLLPVLDAAIGTRINRTEIGGYMTTTNKLYMGGIDSDVVGTTILTGETYEVAYYRGAIPISNDRTASYFVTDYETGKGYMYADWHDLPKVDSIPVPPKYQGRAYTVLEKTSNVTLASGTLGSSLSVSIAATHNYGFVTIEIAV